MTCPFKCETRPLGAAGRDCSLLASDNTPENKLPPPKIQQSSSAAQEAIADLHRDFIGECPRIAAIKAAHGADNIWLGDDLNAERDIRLAVENIREAAILSRMAGQGRAPWLTPFHQWRSVRACSSSGKK
jgi:hypothetical protein